MGWINGSIKCRTVTSRSPVCFLFTPSSRHQFSITLTSLVSWTLLKFLAVWLWQQTCANFNEGVILTSILMFLQTRFAFKAGVVPLGSLEVFLRDYGQCWHDSMIPNLLYRIDIWRLWRKFVYSKLIVILTKPVWLELCNMDRYPALVIKGRISYSVRHSFLNLALKSAHSNSGLHCITAKFNLNVLLDTLGVLLLRFKINVHKFE